MERVELLTSLEQRFAADIPEEETQRLYTVRELVESILSHATGESGEESAAWTRCSRRRGLTQARWMPPFVRMA
jgi:hypothetical protein